MSAFLSTHTRTHSRGALRAGDAGRRVVLTGWVASYRDHGERIFIDLRDRGGVTQLVADRTRLPDVHAIADTVRAEWCIGVVGEGAARRAARQGGGGRGAQAQEDDNEPFFAGLPMGVLSVSKAYPVGDPPAPERVAALEREISGRLRQFYADNFARRLRAALTLVDTAGAVTTLAAMALEMTDYDPVRVNNLVLQKSQVEELASRILALPEAERARLPVLEAGKAGVMVAGVLIILAILETFGGDALVVIDAGLLEGLLREMAA